MKKIFTFSVASLLALSSYSQTDTLNHENENLKSNKGTVSTELNVNPFNGQINLNNSVNQIKLRYFLSENTALRLGFNASNTKQLSDYNYPYGTNPMRFKDERNSTTLGLNLGLEKHFKGSKRLSPYIGADIAITNMSSNSESINGQTTIKVKNAWNEPTIVNGQIINTMQQMLISAMAYIFLLVLIFTLSVISFSDTNLTSDL